MLMTDEITVPASWYSEQHGLKWERDTFSLTPVWTMHPSIQYIEDICRTWLQGIHPPSLCSVDTKVKFLDDGAFNQVYVIDAIITKKATIASQLKSGIIETQEVLKFAFRVSLPVDPLLKSLSEVATLKFLNEYTNIPVPTVLHSSQSVENSLGFEWMLQTYTPGRKLSAIWDELGETGRERMIQQLAEIHAELFNRSRFSKIGNIYCPEGALRDSAQDNIAQGSTEFYVGKIVSNPFILKRATIEVVDRGPFRTTANWLSAQLGNVVLDCQRLEKSSDENDLEAAQRSGEIARRLLTLIPKYFPDNGSVEETSLLHDDMSQENIFCSEDGTITAILDWEATSCLPLWESYSFPQLLQGADYPVEPDPTDYRRGKDDLLFQDRLLMWQRMKLKGKYMQTMERIWPEWFTEHFSIKNVARRDFRSAVDLCDSELWWNTITKWLDANDQLQGADEYVQLELY